ncbi:hypothetical protein EDC04DRAFT_2898639 [Pisolithus marmoratus]|nr:hypothetical protein EDC04DRAFT_2898639 [Pisolithus marmoratus]
MSIAGWASDLSDGADKDSHGSLSSKLEEVALAQISESEECGSPQRVLAWGSCSYIEIAVAARAEVCQELDGFPGSSDELTFTAGNGITVINEVLEDWQLDILEEGLLPINY